MDRLRTPPSRAPAGQRVPLPHNIDRSHSEGLPIGHGSQVALGQLQHEDKTLIISACRWLAWVPTLKLIDLRTLSRQSGGLPQLQAITTQVGSPWETSASSSLTRPSATAKRPDSQT